MTAKPETEHSLPAVHVLHLSEVVEPWGVTPKALLQGMDVDALSKPDARVPISTVIRLVQRARALTGEQGLGFHLGLKLGIAAHGQLGMAAMVAGTLRDSILLASQFGPTRTTALSIHLEEAEGEARIVIEEHADLGAAQDVLIFALFVSLWKIGNVITGSERRGRVDVTFAEPAYFKRFRAGVPGEVRFRQPRHCMRFDADLLDHPLVTADRAALRLAREVCEQQLEALGPSVDVLNRVRQLLPGDAGGYRSLAAVARLMHVSERTLKRRLAGSGESYSGLLDEHRHVQALALLADGALSIELIADRLGYSDAANFTRAFRRWTGGPPNRRRSKRA